MSARVSLRLLGTGNAFNSSARGSAAILVESASSGTTLVDCGPTIGLAVESFGVDTSAIDRVVFTHLHGDHIGGWPFLVLRLLFIDRRQRPLDVIGPEGLRETLETLLRCTYGDLLEGDGVALELRWRELPVRASEGLAIGGGLLLDTVPVDHHATSLGLVLRDGGRRIGISGDSRWCEGIERLLEASDLLLLECTTLEPSAAKHISLAELREHAEKLHGRRVVLVHLDDTVADSLERQPIDGVVAGSDGARLLI